MKYDDKQIFIDENIKYSQVLFYSQISLNEYRSTVEYDNLDAPFVKVKKFCNFNFDIDYQNIDLKNVYVIYIDNIELFEKEGFEIYIFDNYAVAKNK